MASKTAPQGSSAPDGGKRPFAAFTHLLAVCRLVFATTQHIHPPQLHAAWLQKIPPRVEALLHHVKKGFHKKCSTLDGTICMLGPWLQARCSSDGSAHSN